MLQAATEAAASEQTLAQQAAQAAEIEQVHAAYLAQLREAQLTVAQSEGETQQVAAATYIQTQFRAQRESKQLRSLHAAMHAERSIAAEAAHARALEYSEQLQEAQAVHAAALKAAVVSEAGLECYPR